jgi:hypothetical protein
MLKTSLFLSSLFIFLIFTNPLSAQNVIEVGGKKHYIPEFKATSGLPAKSITTMIDSEYMSIISLNQFRLQRISLKPGAHSY